MTDRRDLRPSDWEPTIRERLAAGDEEALGEAYDQFASFVYGIAFRVIGTVRAAEDVAQDVFMKLWEQPTGFEPHPGSLRTWLGTLAHRRAVDCVRREEAKRRTAVRDASRSAVAPDVEEMAMALVTAERVRAARDDLPEEQRVAIPLAYFGGRTYREVAHVLDIPQDSATRCCARYRVGSEAGRAPTIRFART